MGIQIFEPRVCYVRRTLQYISILQIGSITGLAVDRTHYCASLVRGLVVTLRSLGSGPRSLGRAGI
jgi:hypothetical protein